MTEAIRPDAQVIAEQARLATEPKRLEPLNHWLIATPTGHVTVDLDTDLHRRRQGVPPALKSGLFAFTEAESFCAYVAAHEQAERTTLYADQERGTVLALLDDHQRGEEQPGPLLAGWGAHRALLTLKPTTPWLAWTAISGKPQPQLEFAEFLEDHHHDIREPQAAQLLEIASTMQASSGAVMKSALRLDNGQVQIKYEETIEAKAGSAGTLAIPTRITLGLAPWEGMAPFAIEARFRYRLGNGRLAFTVLIDDPERVLRAAFADVLKQLEPLDLPILHGAPPELPR